MHAIAVFTNRGLPRLLAEGGSQSWKLNPARAGKLSYLVCVQNRNDGDWGEPTHQQGQAFLIGKISSVEQSPEAKAKDEDRHIINIAEYSEIDIPDFWQGWRNPVRYIELEDFGIDPRKLAFKPLTNNAGVPSLATSSSPQGMDMAQAKKALAAFYGVPTTSIEITIRG